MARKPPKKFQFTKADAKKCTWAKGNRSKFGKCMAEAVRKRLKNS